MSEVPLEARLGIDRPASDSVMGQKFSVSRPACVRPYSFLRLIGPPRDG
jgi:hypothetical protein